MICSVKRFSEMYETVYRDLYHYALCLMKNPQEAEDAVSEAVVAAYENIHKLKKEEAFRSWIFTILTNKCKKRLKKALKETPGREEELPEQATAPDYDLAIDVKKAFFVLSEEEQIYQSERDARLWAAIDGLPAERKKIFLLSKRDGLKYQEIAEELQISIKTVENQMGKALKTLRETAIRIYCFFFS